MIGIRSTVGASRPTNRRRFTALAVGSLGVLGLALGVASQLDTAWSGNFQAGTTLAELDCQEAGVPVIGSFTGTTFDASAEDPFQPGSVQFTDISPACAGEGYQIAYRTSGDWQLIAEGTVTGSTVTVPLEGAAMSSSAEFAISFVSN